VERSQIRTEDAPAYISWMAQGIRVGDLVFTGGSIPRHPKTLEIPSSFEEQCRAVFDNLEAVLRAAGSSLRRAVKVNIYLADLQNWETMNSFYREYIDEAAPPARTTVQVAGLNNNYQIEVEAVALCQ
jgi:2-iminobutanoate/2-iminopropanoate deaminase